MVSLNLIWHLKTAITAQRVSVLKGFAFTALRVRRGGLRLACKLLNCFHEWRAVNRSRTAFVRGRKNLKSPLFFYKKVRISLIKVWKKIILKDKQFLGNTDKMIFKLMKITNFLTWVVTFSVFFSDKGFMNSRFSLFLVKSFSFLANAMGKKSRSI